MVVPLRRPSVNYSARQKIALESFGKKNQKLNFMLPMHLKLLNQKCHSKKKFPPPVRKGTLKKPMKALLKLLLSVHAHRRMKPGTFAAALQEK